MTVRPSSIESPGAVPGPSTIRGDRARTVSSAPRGIGLSTALFGFAGMALLMGFYLVVMTVAEGFDAAIELLQADWYLIGPLVVGFGVQVGLFASLWRRSRAARSGSATAMTGASTGISGLSMLACCTHHLVDVLPFLGLVGVATFLGQYREQFLLLGVVTNLAGIAFMVRTLRRCRALG